MAWRRGLIVGELAAAVVLLTAAGLMLRSVAALSRLDLGFDPHGLMAITISTASSATTDERRALVDRALPELESIAGVTAAGAVSNRPLFGPVGNDSPVLLEGQTRDAGAANPFVNAMTVTPEYFHTLRARLAQGRFLTRDDRQATERVVVVSAGFAAWAWPDGRALGRRLQVAALGSGRPIWWRVVGVVEDSRNREIASPMFDIYAPFAQSPNAIDTLVVRTAADGAAVLSLIRQRLEPIATGGGVSIESMEDVVAAHEAPWRTNLALFGAFAVLTLIIAATGLYALVARSVLDRSREIGVRLALGATPARVARRVVSDAGRLVVSGALIGLGVAAGASRMLRSLLFGVQPLDPPALAAAPLLLAAIALTACLLPAVRAARTDPAICLRSE